MVLEKATGLSFFTDLPVVVNGKAPRLLSIDGSLWLGDALQIFLLATTIALAVLTFRYIEEPGRLWSRNPRRRQWRRLDYIFGRNTGAVKFADHVHAPSDHHAVVAGFAFATTNYGGRGIATMPKRAVEKAADDLIRQWTNRWDSQNDALFYTSRV